MSDIDEEVTAILLEYGNVENVWEHCCKHKHNFSILALEKILLMDIRYACMYANKNIRGRWKELEELILEKKNNTIAYAYSVGVIGGPCPELESVIASAADSSYVYAYHVLHGRFKPGEPIISRNMFYSELYAKHVLDEYAEGKDAQNLILSYIFEK